MKTLTLSGQKVVSMGYRNVSLLRDISKYSGILLYCHVEIHFPNFELR